MLVTKMSVPLDLLPFLNSLDFSLLVTSCYTFAHYFRYLSISVPDLSCYGVEKLINTRYYSLPTILKIERSLNATEKCLMRVKPSCKRST